MYTAIINCCITYKHGVNASFYNNYTCRFIVVICYVYMDDNTNYLISFVFNKTEKTKCILKCICHFIQKIVYYYCMSPE